MNAAAETTPALPTFALYGNAPGAVGHLLPLVGNPTREQAETVADIFRGPGYERTVRVVEIDPKLAANWHRARAAERGIDS
jgi:hypothetical protein